MVDEVVCAQTPEPFHAVGLWYEDFSQTDDEEVRELLALAAREATVTRPTRPAGGQVARTVPTRARMMPTIDRLGS